jgi:hypothetical protein
MKIESLGEEGGKIANWIAPVDPDAKLVTHTKKARGHGFSMESSKDGKMALLERFYASGNSGAGKTVLTSSAVEEIRSLVSKDWTIGFA